MRFRSEFEANLIEMVQRSRGRHLSSEPGRLYPLTCILRPTNSRFSEILSLIQQSLRAKVASLDEDNWMFEVEDDTLA